METILIGATICGIDHQGLKYLLKKKVSTPMQQNWVSKLMGYDLLVEYRKGNENTVTDALSKPLEGVPT